MYFTKLHGAGNDFVLVEAGDKNTGWSKLAVKLCDRHYGIGADGLLVLLPSVEADFRMRIFNADGSEADACGNGLRCMIRYYLDKKAMENSDTEIRVETRSGIRSARLVKSGRNTLVIETSMGKPVFGESDIPVKEGTCLVDIKNIRYCSIPVFGRSFELYLVSMGNPHAVSFIDSPVSEFPLSQAGPEISGNRVFFKGINFEVVRVISRKKIEARVWERGVGETFACGSGACAVAVVAFLKGFVGRSVDIVLPGGVLHCVWDGSGEVFLSGPAETVFTGEWAG